MAQSNPAVLSQSGTLGWPLPPDLGGSSSPSPSAQCIGTQRLFKRRGTESSVADRVVSVTVVPLTRPFQNLASSKAMKDACRSLPVIEIVGKAAPPTATPHAPAYKPAFATLQRLAVRAPQSFPYEQTQQDFGLVSHSFAFYLSEIAHGRKSKKKSSSTSAVHRNGPQFEIFPGSRAPRSAIVL